MNHELAHTRFVFRPVLMASDYLRFLALNNISRIPAGIFKNLVKLQGLWGGGHVLLPRSAISV